MKLAIDVNKWNLINRGCVTKGTSYLYQTQQDRE